ncbi:MAG TPA: prolyl oligopeptidase family serine peptidase [Gemmataceae bacterium]|nr:prolyl oligopeptidase family serine peptidase [Gemmataceae bacterium]
MLHRRSTAALLLALLFAGLPSLGAAEAKAPVPVKKTEELTLEKLFPKKGLFGQPGHGMAFSFDGKYAAYLHRPYKEERHGSDLWLFDVASGKTTQVTSMAKMAKYQASARAVTDKTGRYSGVSSFTWSPTAHELLFTSEGDIYRWKVGDGTPARLTMTRAPEFAVQYLHDGRGYTSLRESALLRVEFGSHLVEQIDPKLPDGETLASYKISPDGKHLAFTTRKGRGPLSGDRKVNIASYRDRFMKVNEVPRHVSEDPLPAVEVKVYLHDLSEAMVENGTLSAVLTHKYSGPRDVLTNLDWTPDSRKIAFALFQQSNAEVQILIAEIGADPKKEGAKREAAKPAKVVHRFTHNGGPNTPAMMQPRFLDDSRRLVLLTEQTGFRQLHILDPLYESIEQVTSGRCEVYPISLLKDRKTYYVSATKEHPSRRDVYRVDLVERKMERLTAGSGVYDDVAVSPDGKTLLANYARFGAPVETVRITTECGCQEVLTNSHPETARRLATVRPEFFTYKNRHGHDIHGFLFKPLNWSKADKRPLLIYVYGGPLGTRKQVTEGNYHADSYFFARYMAERHGYVTCTIDPRGMSGYGGTFEKASFERVGKPQTEDLVDGVKYLVANLGVDAKRVGIHGWSFGGFQTQMCMYTEPDVFAVGIAGAGPTEWENYNAWYSTGTIGSTRTGQPDLGKFSLLPLAKNLKGKLLLVHGMEDSNVLYQDTVRVYRELLKAGKETQVELFLDPTGGHGLGGDIDRLAKARKYEDFLLRHLGKGSPLSVGPISAATK